MSAINYDGIASGTRWAIERCSTGSVSVSINSTVAEAQVADAPRTAQRISGHKIGLTQSGRNLLLGFAAKN
jgi:hypothetical protein